MRADANTLEFLFGLNQELAEKEATLQQVIGPGLPSVVKDASEFITEDCIRVDTGNQSLRCGRVT
jgi:hypothetical protein